MFTLFYTPKTCSLASHIALEIAGATYETRRVDFAKNEQNSPEFLRLNPKGRVPALITERGLLTETSAILLFIAQTFPSANLAPLSDAFALAQMQAVNSYLGSTLHVAHAHKFRGARWADDPAAIEAMKLKVPQSVGAAFDMVEHELLQGPWVMGEQFSVADIYLFTMAQWMEGDGLDMARYPKVIDHRARMSAMPAVQKVLAVEGAA